ncbi:MAG: NADH-quinone oxidoreductase subunit NuoG [Pseudomonadota bacterium]
MSDERVNLEINGVPLKAQKGSMLIEAADEANIRIPRFCYHRKLSIAANCRMCLVEVERAPKPMPACATPVVEGMKVYTRSAKALAAQQATMEFLLINHPLDCPICDQGGECELQDVAMGYGEDVSRYTESKRVVQDQDIGPLVSTDMTRCIHCTRCVRFGAEIAGIREMGATGRGEFVRIGTYVEKALSSELSGNVIDLCPVGALNAKPSRMAARAWEMIQHPTVAAHDSVGSNLYLHTLRGQVVRAVPRDNEDINETWISDRDRFSYQGLYTEDRLEKPMLKVDDAWQEVDWETALQAVADGLRSVSSDQVGALTASNVTLEEMYLLQRLMRGIKVHNIDHRLRQTDFSDQDRAPLFPWLGQSIEDLERLDAVLIVGSNIRKEQPIVAHRLRKASLKGADIMLVNPRDFEFTFNVSEKIIAQPWSMIAELAGIAKAVLKLSSAKKTPAPFAKLLYGVKPTQSHQAIATKLSKANQASVLLGTLSTHHPAFSILRALTSLIAEHTEARFGYLPEGANTAGAWLAGALPHRLAAGQDDATPGLDAGAMLGKALQAYLLYALEPDYDCDNPGGALKTMEAAEFVVVCAPFASETTKRYADVLLPISTFVETSGTFINAEGRWQSFQGATNPPGEARPGWKVLRVLGNLCGVDDFDYLSSEQVRDQLKAQFSEHLEFDNRLGLNGALAKPAPDKGLIRACEVPIYALDPLVRRSAPLQQTPDSKPAAAYLSAPQAEALGVTGGQQVIVQQDDYQAELPLIIDDSIPSGCVWIPAGLKGTRALGSGVGSVELRKVRT